jgi:hypothetical protein
MVAEAIAAATVGMLALFLVLRPLFRAASAIGGPVEPLEPEETPKGWL